MACSRECVVLLVLLSASWILVQAGTFYHGCFHGNSTSTWKQVAIAGQSEQPFVCVKSCQEQRFSFAGVQHNGTICLCGTQLQLSSKVNRTFCEPRCKSGLDCGAFNYSSIYSTNVPSISYIAFEPHPDGMLTNSIYMLYANVTINRTNNTRNLLINFNNLTLTNLKLIWKVNNKVINTSIHELEDQHLESSFRVPVLNHPGTIQICLEARNLFSDVERCTSVEVLVPVNGVHLVDVLPQQESKYGANTSMVLINNAVKVKIAVESGSKVTFSFNFGDGTPRTTKPAGISNPLQANQPVCLTFEHCYKKCGNFTLSVIVRNSLSQQKLNFPPRFKVENRDFSIGLLPRKFFGSPNEAITMKVTVERGLESGCQLHFNWTFGDGSPDVSTTEPKVTHLYSDLGRYSASVKVFNQVNSMVQGKVVFIEPTLTGVVLSIKNQAKPYVFDTIQGYTFLADVTPDNSNPGSQEYTWHFQSKGSTENEPGSIGSRLHKFKSPGRYNFSVTVHNGISRVTSNSVIVVAQERIGKVSLNSASQMELGQVTVYEVTVTAGSHLSIWWDFGDGESSITNTTTVAHTYKRRGKYVVSAMVFNQISHKNTSLTVYVTQFASCQLGVEISGKENLQIRRSARLCLETVSRLKCHSNTELLYSWKVLTAPEIASSDEPRTISLDGVNLTQPVLIVPPSSLPYDNLQFIVKVRMAGSVLEATAFKKVQVVQHGLVAVIKGGSIRVVGYQSKGNITLDGRHSYDPDFPVDSTNLKFRWISRVLSGRNDGFDPLLNASVLTMNSPVLTFPADILIRNIEALNITLVVSKEGLEKPRQALQMIRLVNAEPHLLSISCPQCSLGKVNPSERLVLRSVCMNCEQGSSNVLFEWKLYLVRKTYQGVQPDAVCVSHPTESATPTTPATDGNNRPDPTPRPMTGQTLRPTDRNPSRSHTVRPSGSIIVTTNRPPYSGPLVETGNVCRRKIVQPPPPIPTTRCHYVTLLPRFGGSKRWSCATGPSAAPPRSRSTRGWSSAIGISTNRPLGTGSIPRFPHSKAPIPSNGQPTTATPTTQPTTWGSSTTPEPTKTSGDLYDPSYIVRQPPSIHSFFNTQRWEVSLKSTQTATGTGSANLVIEKGSLVSGLRYMLALEAKNKLNNRRGMASIFFEMNSKPRPGRCILSPYAGTEMNTVFTVECSGWRDENQPIGYEVYYHNDEKGVKNLLYSGYNDHIPVLLPAGRQQNNFIVYVTVSVFNSKRVSVSLCPISVTVKPASFNQSASAEEILYNKTTGEGLRFLQRTGQEQTARQLLMITAKILNSLETVKPTSSRHSLRESTRTAMLRLLEDFTIRDKSSAIQSAETLEVITRRANEVNNESLRVASGIVRNIGDQIQHATDETNNLEDSDVELVAKLSSNLLKCSVDVMDRSKLRANGTGVNGHNRSYWREVARNILDVVNGIVKLKTVQMVLGESSSEVNLPLLSLLSKQTSSVSSSAFSLRNVAFLLPASLKSVLKRTRRTLSVSNQRCYGTMATVYDKNPYVWGEDQFLAHSKVASLALSTCDGENIEVKNLEEEIVIQLPWNENMASERTEKRASLEWQHLNIHTFSVVHRKDQFLHLNLSLSSPLEPGFVMQLLLGTGVNNSLDEFKVLNETYGADIDVFLSKKHFVNVSNKIEIGLFLKDADQSRIKKIQSVRSIDYLLASRWMGCYYWHETAEAWYGDGCRTIENTTTRVIHCSCNHLTVFSGVINLAPNPLRVQDLRKIVSVSENPVALALVMCLVLVYFVLLPFCVRADRYDKRKRAIVHISNAPLRTPKRYQITVETGHWFNSGTTASVVILLHGENHSSDPIELSCHSKPVFQRGSNDVFIISCAENLSPVWKIHVWHYNDGGNPSWFLNRVTVKDLQTNKKWNFDCYRWLAVDEEDGQVDVEILASSNENVNHFVDFYHKCIRGILDYHMWLSVLGRPSYSRFTRAQRLSCCWSLLLSYLCVNAAWYHVNSKPPDVLGFLDITWQTVVVGLMSGIVAFLPNLLWIVIFRYSKPPKFPAKKEQSLPMHETVTESTFLPGPSLFGEEDSLSILDQSIETLLHLRYIGTKRTWPSSYMVTGTSLDSILEGFSYSEKSLLDSGDKLSLDVFESEQKTAERVREMRSGATSPVSTAVESMDVGRSEIGIRRLPHACIYVAWVGCLLTASVASVVTIWYGLSFGREKSFRWLQALCISLMESLLLSQPIAVVVVPLYVLCSNCRKRKVSPVKVADEDADEGFEDMPITPFTFPKCDAEEASDRLKMSLAIRQRQRYLKFLRPPKKAILYDAFVKRLRERTVREYILEFSLTCVFLLIVGFLISGLWCSGTYHINQTISQTLSKHTDDSQNTVHSWWGSNHGKVLDVLYWSPPGRSQTPEIFFQGTQNVLVGKPRFSQCRSSYREVCINGTRSLRTQLGPVNSSGKGCWLECDVRSMRMCSSVELSRWRSQAEHTIRRMFVDDWINECSLQITIHFTLFAPHANIYSTVAWQVKSSPAGKPTTHGHVHSFHGNFSGTSYSAFLKICKVLFVLCNFYFIHRVLKGLFKTKQAFFSHFWNCLELVLVLMSSLAIIFYVRWSISLFALYREVWTKLHDDVFLVGEMVYDSEHILLQLYGVLVFILIIKCLHVLRVVKFIYRLGVTLAVASHNLLGLLVLSLVLVFAFAHPGYLLFGIHHAAFQTFSSAFLSVSGVLRMRGVGVLEDGFHDQFPVFSVLYVVLYLAGFVLVFRGLSAAIIRWSFHSSRKRQDCHTAHILHEHIINKFYSLKTRKTLEEPESEEDEEDEDYDKEVQKIVPVEYAVDEVETQIEELLFRMENLVGGGNLKCRQFTYSTESSEDGDGDVEYLYCRDDPDEHYIGSGYESEWPSRDSLDSPRNDYRRPEDLFSDTSWPSIPRAPSVGASHGSDDEGLWLRPIVTKPIFEEKSRLQVKRGSEGLSSSSGHSMPRRRQDPPRELSRPKQFHPLTRKPKIRPGQSFLDHDFRGDRYSEEIEIPDETRGYSDASPTRRRGKRRGHLRGLGILPVTAVSPDEPTPPAVREAFVNKLMDDGGSTNHARDMPTYGETRAVRQGSDWTEIDGSKPYTLPPLRGIVGDISMNSVPETAIGRSNNQQTNQLG